MTPSLIRTARAALPTVALSAIAVVSPGPAHASPNCTQSPVVNGVATGTVNDTTHKVDYWFDNTTGINQSKLATLTPVGGAAALVVYGGDNCSEVVCSVGTEGNGTATCPVPDEPSTIMVSGEECCQDIPYVLTVTGGSVLLENLPPVDDLPEPGICGPSPICVGLFPGDVVASFPVVIPGIGGGATHEIAGYVDIYRFVLPGDAVVTLPCPVLTVDTTINPCEQLGGTFVSRLATLADLDVSEPVIGGGGDPLTTIRICEATLVATVLGVGVESFPAFSLC